MAKKINHRQAAIREAKKAAFNITGAAVPEVGKLLHVGGAMTHGTKAIQHGAKAIEEQVRRRTLKVRRSLKNSTSIFSQSFGRTRSKRSSRRRR